MVSKSKKADVSALFYAGKYREVLALLEHRASDGTKDHRLLVEEVGSRVFLGEVSEAELIFGRAQKELSQEQRVACRFFIGVGQTRMSRYDDARKNFAKNLELLRQTQRKGLQLTPRELFYIYQGLAFYRFYFSRFRRTIFYTVHSADAAMLGNFAYGRVLALDLRGHSEVRIGQVRLGLKLLREALQGAEKLSNGGLADSIGVSTLLYPAQFGIDPRRKFLALRKESSRLADTQNTYTTAELNLELVRQYLLQGNANLAKALLNQTAEIVYRNQNRRQATVLNLLFARLQFLAGEPHIAMNILKTAEQNLVPKVDRLLKTQLLGLQFKIAQTLDAKTQSEETGRQLAADAPTCSSAKNFRILSRSGSNSQAYEAFISRRGEDPLGDLIDDLAQKVPGAIENAIDLGFFGLLADVIGVAPHERVLAIGLKPDSLLLLEKGEAHWIEGAFKGISFKFLTSVVQGRGEKSQLVKSVWGYEYHPLRHDPLIFAAAAKLRRLLGPFASWLSYDETGFHLKAVLKDVSVQPADGLSARLKEELNSPVETGTYQSFGIPKNIGKLTHREFLILQVLSKRHFIGVADCSDLLMTSTATACRDLTSLLQLGMVSRVGRARGTRYYLNVKKAGKLLNGEI